MPASDISTIDSADRPPRSPCRHAGAGQCGFAGEHPEQTGGGTGAVLAWGQSRLQHPIGQPCLHSVLCLSSRGLVGAPAVDWLVTSFVVVPAAFRPLVREWHRLACCASATSGSAKRKHRQHHRRDAR
jgi:hypothetical protein